MIYHLCCSYLHRTAMQYVMYLVSVLICTLHLCWYLPRFYLPYFCVVLAEWWGSYRRQRSWLGPGSQAGRASRGKVNRTVDGSGGFVFGHGGADGIERFGDAVGWRSGSRWEERNLLNANAIERRVTPCTFNVFSIMSCYICRAQK